MSINTQTAASAVGSISVAEVAHRWAVAFGKALEERDDAALKALFREEGTFRDLLALSWDLRNAVGSRKIAELLAGPSSTPPIGLSLRPDSVPRLSVDPNGVESIAAFLDFATTQGSGHGFVELRLTNDGSWAAEACVLALNTLEKRPERVGDLRQDGRTHAPWPGRLSWPDQVDPEFRRNDPDVVILGAGHNGLMLAARLKAMGVGVLVIERNARVGDNWRNRYDSLALHTLLISDELPYVKYPETWPKQAPKQKFADFLESYAALLDIPVWTGSHADNVRRAEGTHSWTLDVHRPDGTTRSIETAHLVFATGLNGEPRLPDLPGANEFRGTIMHAQNYRGHAEWAGRRVVVVGSGVSGHDIAQDLAEHGVDVTLVQRSGTMVLDCPTYHKLMFPNYLSGHYTVEEADLMGAAVPFGVLPTRGAAMLEKANLEDRELLDRLEEKGFQLSKGPNGQGLLGAIFGGATGYYFNVGASDLIIDGTIGLHRGEVTGFGPTGPTFDDGSTLEADLVVFATGYQPAKTRVEAVLGSEVAQTLGSFRVDESGEFGRYWRKTGVDHLWLMITLGIDGGRFYSKLLALQIAAEVAADAEDETTRSPAQAS